MKNRISITRKGIVLYTIPIIASVLNLNSQVSIAQGEVIAYGAVITQVAADHSFTEGPAVDPQGNVYFTDQPNDRIYKWSPDGTITLFMEGARRSNGLYFDNDGNLLSCADLNNQLVRIDQDKNITVVIGDFEGKRLTGPNDLWVNATGGIYFPDPFYKRPWWEHSEKEIEDDQTSLNKPITTLITSL